MRRKTHEEFVEEFKRDNLEIYNQVELMTEYENCRKRILVKTKYGVCSVLPDEIAKSGKMPSIQSALYMQQYFLNMLKDKNYLAYSTLEFLDNYENNGKKIRVRDRYGILVTTAGTLLCGRIPSFSSAEDKHGYMIAMMQERNPEILHEIEFVEECKKLGSYMIAKHKYGLVKVKPSRLLAGHGVDFRSAVDPHQFFLNQLADVNKVAYDKIISFEEPVKLYKKSYIAETKYGKIKVVPNRLLSGQYQLGVQSSVNKNEYFANMANEVHSFRYDYSKVEYSKGDKKVKIICPEHGEFPQTPTHHLMGHGCPECSYLGWSKDDWLAKASRSLRIDSFKVYVLKCYDESENFFKIGLTFNTVEERYKASKKIPYKYDVIRIFEFETAEEAWDYEKNLHRIHNNVNLHYVPKKEFAGCKRECFSELII